MYMYIYIYIYIRVYVNSVKDHKLVKYIQLCLNNNKNVYNLVEVQAQLPHGLGHDVAVRPPPAQRKRRRAD